MRKIFIDCDPGHDDAMAIMLAAAHEKEFEILGITTVGGNQTIEKVTQNTCKILTMIDKNIPVVAGNQNPIIKELKTATEHGETGMDGPVVDEILHKPLDINVLDFYKEKLSNVDKATIIALGPLTNIALLIKAYPELKEKIECIALMGGSVYSGNATSKSEFNFFVDPHAAKIVFNSGIKIVQAGLEVCDAASILLSEIDEFKGDGRVSNFVYDLFSFYRHIPIKLGKDRCAIFDTCPVMYLLHPEIFKAKEYHVDIETTGELTSGMSVVDTRHWFDLKKPNTTVLLDVDREKFISYFISSIKKLDNN